MVSQSHPNYAFAQHSNPFWMPFELNIPDSNFPSGYFKVNVFIAGLETNTGIIKVCVIPHGTEELCHYMDAFEEGQIIQSNVSTHAGIFVFPSQQVRPTTMVNVCMTVLKDERTICDAIINSPEKKEEMVDLILKDE